MERHDQRASVQAQSHATCYKLDLGLSDDMNE
jgi:hypothetical protein